MKIQSALALTDPHEAEICLNKRNWILKIIEIRRKQKFNPSVSVQTRVDRSYAVTHAIYFSGIQSNPLEHIGTRST